MKFFIDTANLEEIREANEMGILDGVTTNPSLMAKEGIKDAKAHYLRICEVVDGDVSAEVISTDYHGIVREGRSLVKIHPNITVKIPMIRNGVKAIKTLAGEGVKINCTLIFNAAQALVAAKAGAKYVSPFIGRLDDLGQDGMVLIQDIRTIFDNYGIKTQILAASIRHNQHHLACMLAGADVGTLPFKVIESMIKHPLTDLGLEKFLSDYESIADEIS